MRVLNKDFLRKMVLSLIAGGSGKLLDLLVFMLLFQCLLIDKFLANAIGISCGTVLSFVINIMLIFKVRGKIFRRFFIFYMTGIFGIFLSSIILWIGAFLVLPVLPVRYFSMVFVAFVHFLINYLFTFEGGKS